MMFERNDAGFNAIRKQAQFANMAKSKAESIAAAANAIPSTTDPATEEPYYEVFEAGDGSRARYRVATASLRAQRHEARTLALEQGFSAATSG
jgi:hypothetical protein